MTGLPATRRAPIAALLATLFVASTHAHAQADPTPSSDAKAQPAAKGGEPGSFERKRARRLFEEAAELESKREWTAATAKLQEALGIVETPGLRYHLAYCQEEQGLMVEALANYERAQQMIAGGSKAPDVAELLAPKRDALLTRIPKLRVRARAPAVIERVAVDGVVLAPGQLSQPIALNPGRRRVTAWAKGQAKPLEREIVVSEGRESAEEFAWPPSSPGSGTSVAPAPLTPAQRDVATEPEAPPRSSGMSARTVVLIAEASLTAVALGVGIGFLASTNSAADDAEALRDRLPLGNPCAAPPTQFATDCAELDEAISRQKNHEPIAVASFITAGVGAAATVTTWFLWKPSPNGAALGVNVTPTANGGALELRGRF